MKKIIYSVILLSVAGTAFGQVALGKESIEGNSTLLDFDNSTSNIKGIILPAVQNTPSGLNENNNGTFLYDRTLQQVRMYENNDWIDLTDPGNSSTVQVNTSIENNQGQGVIIGSNTSSAKGILILESIDKALILPKINRPHENVKSPYPGMMCYDVESKSLAVFDGINWSYWK